VTDFQLDFTIAADTYRLHRKTEGKGWTISKGVEPLQDYPLIESAFASILEAYNWSGETPDPDLFGAVEAVLMKHDIKGDN
jgi:hypothetical protein